MKERIQQLFHENPGMESVDLRNVGGSTYQANSIYFDGIPVPQELQPVRHALRVRHDGLHVMSLAPSIYRFAGKRYCYVDLDNPAASREEALKGQTYTVQVAADTLFADCGKTYRITTIEATFPRFILAEMNTHRVLSRCSASSRAIPPAKRIEMVRSNPFVPEVFSKNQKGMQASAAVEDQEGSRDVWLKAAAYAADRAEELDKKGVHKQHANRIIEPYVWHTAVLTATEWDNFEALRTELQDDGVTPMAQPEMYLTALLMEFSRRVSVPRSLNVLGGLMQGAYGQHLPYIRENESLADLAGVVGSTEDTFGDALAKVSAARSARTSMDSAHVIKEASNDMALFDMLTSNGHWSPLEHPAKPLASMDLRNVRWKKDEKGEYWVGPNKGWVSLRSTFRGEDLRIPKKRGQLLGGCFLEPHRAACSASWSRPARVRSGLTSMQYPWIKYEGQIRSTCGTWLGRWSTGMFLWRFFSGASLQEYVQRGNIPRWLKYSCTRAPYWSCR